MVRQTLGSGATITGPGTTSNAHAILDMSGLAMFTANVDQLLVGYNTNNSSGTAYERANGTFTLPRPIRLDVLCRPNSSATKPL